MHSAKDGRSAKGCPLGGKCLGFVIPLLSIVGLSVAWLDIKSICVQVKMSTALSEKQEIKSLLAIFIFTRLASLFLTFLRSSFAYRFIAASYRAAMQHFLRDYIRLKYCAFNMIGVGCIQHSISKRADAFTEFLTTISISMVANACFCLCALEIIRENLTLVANLKVFTDILFFLLFSVYVHSRRAMLRRKINHAYEANSAKALDILMNYERIVTFDNTEVELAKYHRALDPQIAYKRAYELTYELISFINQSILLFLTCLIISEYNNSETIKENILIFILISVKLSEVIYNFSKDIDHVFVSHTNLKANYILKQDVEDYSRGIPIYKFDQEISIQKLCFSYKEKPIIRDVSCQIKKGEKIAVTGANGCGKSLFIKLLQGLFEYRGSIKIDNIELRDLNRVSLVGLMGYIPQSTRLLNKSIMANLLDGNPLLSEGEIVSVAKRLNFHALFSQLGYGRSVGERGENLSGGQRQKLCFTRAILRDAPIILMDKACASMDSKSELDVVDLIHKSMEDNMINLKFYDKIFHFGNNTLLEAGSFEDLMLKKGSFHNFFTEIA